MITQTEVDRKQQRGHHQLQPRTRRSLRRGRLIEAQDYTRLQPIAVFGSVPPPPPVACVKLGTAVCDPGLTRLPLLATGFLTSYCLTRHRRLRQTIESVAVFALVCLQKWQFRRRSRNDPLAVYCSLLQFLCRPRHHHRRGSQNRYRCSTRPAAPTAPAACFVSRTFGRDFDAANSHYARHPLADWRIVFRDMA